MRLFVDSYDIQSKRMYLPYNAKNRCELRCEIGSKFFKIGDHLYSVDNVKADGPVIGQYVGAVIGFIGGLCVNVTCAGIGVLAGYYLGLVMDPDYNAVKVFNKSICK